MTAKEIIGGRARLLQQLSDASLDRSWVFELLTPQQVGTAEVGTTMQGMMPTGANRVTVYDASLGGGIPIISVLGRVLTPKEARRLGELLCSLYPAEDVAASEAEKEGTT